MGIKRLQFYDEECLFDKDLGIFEWKKLKLKSSEEDKKIPC